MALPPQFLDELRGRTPLSAVIGRRVRLARSGRQWKGCCPFHGEKTPSFYVYDDHYHCFGCGAHGDAIGFVMQSQGAGFMEAVEQLAAEAGLEVPKPSPEAAEADRRRHDLTSVLELAQTTYQRRLRLPEGRAALDYLRGRGLSDETIQRFGLGWSGEGRGALIGELKREGIEQDRLMETGLLRGGEDGGRVGELFFNRVMFPICDRRGRVISFGGRTLGDGQPKYLNGPETALFSKRRNLYALDLARAARGATIVVVEGYMDVIALHQAGFTGAVAPLGTALTEEQLEELWRLSPAPVLCFDGDAAGARAAARSADLALPLLAPDRSLRIATLPGGEDPDTLVRRQGNAAFQGVLDAARPLAEALYDMLREGGGDSTPEQRAAFRTRLEDTARRIPDKTLAGEYRRELQNRFFDAQRKKRPVQWRAGQRGQSQQPSTSTRTPPRPTPSADGVVHERIRVLTAILLRHPGLLHDVAHAYAALALPPTLDRLRHALIAWAHAADPLDSAALMSHLETSGMADEVGQALAAVPVPLPSCAAPDVMPAEAEAGWWHIFGFLNVARLREEVAEAEADFARAMTPVNQNRLRARKEALLRVESGEPDEIAA
ncbi:MAG TPA: DNA primase [Acetobacteraceae bacterium]|jgi:DNA primase|nr:DNA primase [Acetobacteraceae bacterium]